MTGAGAGEEYCLSYQMSFEDDFSVQLPLLFCHHRSPSLLLPGQTSDDGVPHYYGIRHWQVCALTSADHNYSVHLRPCLTWLCGESVRCPTPWMPVAKCALSVPIWVDHCHRPPPRADLCHGQGYRKVP